MLSLVSVVQGFSGQSMQAVARTYTPNMVAWNALWSDSPSAYWYDPVGSPILQGYQAIVEGAYDGHVPAGVASDSSVTMKYYSADPFKAAMALQLIFPFGTFNVIDVVSFDANYKILTAETYAPAAMVGYNASVVDGSMAWYDMITDGATAYINAVVGFHTSPNGAETWNSLWSNSPDTFWYDPVGTPVLQGYQAVTDGAAGIGLPAPHVPPGAMNTSAVTTVYYSAGDRQAAVLGLSLCFTFAGGACFDVIDVVTYDRFWKLSSASTYVSSPALIPGANATAPNGGLAYIPPISAAFDAYIQAVINYHL